MKKLVYLIFALVIAGLVAPRIASVADVDWFGQFSALGGAERVTQQTKVDGTSGGNHGLLMGEALGMIPITPMIGIQMSGAFGYGFGQDRKSVV